MRKAISFWSMMAVAASFATTPAHAVSFVGVGDSYQVDFNGIVDGSVTTGLTSTITYTLAGVVGNSYLMDFVVTNTSSNPITNSRVSAFGFDVDPNIVSSSITAGTVFDGTSSGNVPQLGSREFCATAGPNCAGGSGNGVLLGGSNAGQFKLDFALLPAVMNITNFYVRYQSIDSPGLNGASAVGTPTNITAPVPEPASWAMMITGFGLAGASMRRRKVAFRFV